MTDPKPANDPKPNGKPGESEPPAFNDDEFFASEGITDEEEKDAIRSRARVHRYVNWRSKKESESDEPDKDKKRSRRKPWYKSGE